MNQRSENSGLSRRHFLASAVAASTALSAPAVLAQARPRVVVVGGGAGGATAARYIAKDSDGAVDLTLVEPSRAYYSCFFSNLYIGGFRDFASIGHRYGALVAKHRINVVHDWAVSVDRDARSVGLAGGASLPYDRLVLSPGIDFRPGSVPGWDLSQQNRMPHAYKAGSQTQLLRAQIEAMPQGGVYCMVAPPNPFRCPPGPYERISMVAHVLKQSNPAAKILIVDPKEKFSKQGLFEDGWQRHYPGMIERIGPDFGGGNVEVRPASMGGRGRRRGDEGGRMQCHFRAAGRAHRGASGHHRRFGLGAGSAAHHAEPGGREHPCARRRRAAGRHAEVGFLGQ